MQGTLAVAIPFMLISFGETQISSGLTGVLISPGPLFIAMLAPLIDPTEKVDRRAGIGVVVGFAGVMLLIGVDTVHSTGEFLGALAMVGAALAYGLGAMYARLKFRGVPPLVVAFASCAVAAVLTLPPALATIGENHPDLGEIAAVVSLGAIGTAVAFYLYFDADRGGRRRQGRPVRVPDPAPGARLWRGVPRRGDHARLDRRADADPDRSGACQQRARG